MNSSRFIKNMNRGTSNVYAWIDCETTGLDPDKDALMEVAVIMTTSTDLREIRRLHLIIHQDADVLDDMNSWCQSMHRKPRPTDGGKSLVDLCLGSSVSVAKGEKILCDFLDAHRGCMVDNPKWLIMCGSSVDFDKKFLLKHMPSLKSRFHYRVIDVSSLMEVSKRFLVGLRLPAVKTSHCAMDDIRDSLNLLRFLRKTVIVNPSGHPLDMPDYEAAVTKWGFDVIGGLPAPSYLDYLDNQVKDQETQQEKIKRLEKQVESLGSAVALFARKIIKK